MAETIEIPELQRILTALSLQLPAEVSRDSSQRIKEAVAAHVREERARVWEEAAALVDDKLHHTVGWGSYRMVDELKRRADAERKKRYA